MAERNGGKEFKVSWKVRLLTATTHADAPGLRRCHSASPLRGAALTDAVGASCQCSGDGRARCLARQKEEEGVQVAGAQTAECRGVGGARGQAGEAAQGRGGGVIGARRVGEQLRRVRGRRREQARADAQVGAGDHRGIDGCFAAPGGGDRHGGRSGRLRIGGLGRQHCRLTRQALTSPLEAAGLAGIAVEALNHRLPAQSQSRGGGAAELERGGG